MEQSVINNTIWVLFCTALVFLMQAGFCCLETGLSRSKNSINVAIKNVVDFCIGALLFCLFGYQADRSPETGGIDRTLRRQAGPDKAGAAAQR